MNTTKALLLALASLALPCAAGCYSGIAYSPSGSPIGLIYNGTESARLVTANPVGAKHGEACGISILGLITIGDSTAATAAKAGGITKISIVDNNDMNILGIYASHCSEVSGD